MIRSFDGSIIERIDKGENSIAAAEELCLCPDSTTESDLRLLGLDNFFLLCDDGAGRFLRCRR